MLVVLRVEAIGALGKTGRTVRLKLLRAVENLPSSLRHFRARFDFELVVALAGVVCFGVSLVHRREQSSQLRAFGERRCTCSTTGGVLRVTDRVLARGTAGMERMCGE